MNFFKRSERNYYLKLLSFALGILFLAVGYSIVYIPVLVVLIIIGIIFLYFSFFENPFSKIHTKTNLSLENKDESKSNLKVAKIVKTASKKKVTKKVPVSESKKTTKATKSVSKKSKK